MAMEAIASPFARPAVKTEVNVLAPTNVHVHRDFKVPSAKVTLMNVHLDRLCTNALQIRHVSTSQDGNFFYTFSRFN